MHCHFIQANSAVVATRRSLSPDHPLRRLIKPFIYRTPTINGDAALLLVSRRAIFNRLFAFEWDGISALYVQSLKDWKFETVRESQKRRGVHELSGFAWGHDSQRFWDVLQKYVEDYLGLYYGGRNAAEDPDVKRWLTDIDTLVPTPLGVTDTAGLVRLRTLYLFNGTAFHEHVGGQIGDYVCDLRFVVPNGREGRSVEEMWASRQTMVQSYMLGVLTSFVMPPLLGDYTRILLDADAQGLWGELQGRLGTLATSVEVLNASRALPLETFNPRKNEISVSI